MNIIFIITFIVFLIMIYYVIYYHNLIQNNKIEVDNLNLEIQKLKVLKENLQNNYEEYKMEYELPIEILNYSNIYKELSSSELKGELLKIQNDINILISSKDDSKSAFKYIGKYDITDKSIRKYFEVKQRLLIRHFNSEFQLLINDLKINNYDTTLKKFQKLFTQINNLYDYDDIKLTKKFFNLKVNELILLHSYLVVQENEKENQRYIKEQLLEEEKARKEYEKAILQLEKEEKQFNKELDKLTKYLSRSNSDLEKELYIAKIKELEEKLNQIRTDKKDIENKKSNTRAGYVYIISNIGAFGENIYKIGVTRRLEPMDRINELSNASVPFKFDVHAIIFSDDAPNLENKLHQHFNNQRVNKINLRKEFFNVSLDEIKKIISENYNKTVKYIDIPEAIEYNETLKLSITNK